MPWYEKETTSPFETLDLPIHGLVFLDGDQLARLLGVDWTKGQKYPQITFPNGETFDIWESGNPAHGGIVHFWGEMDLPLRITRDQAFAHAADIAEQVGYLARKVGQNQLLLIGNDTDEHTLLTFDNNRPEIINAETVKSPPAEKPKHPGHVLMNDAIREQLPPLYSQEDKGLDAIAPVKYFHVNGWYWFPTEFDPEHGLFFSLVVGYEIELGYFTLGELASIGGDPQSLPVERDLYYQPKTLRELQTYHRQLRGEGGRDRT